MDLVWGVKGGGLSGRGNSDRIGGEGGGDAVSRHRGATLQISNIGALKN